MYIENRTRKKRLANKATLCESFFCKIRGLMFTKPIVDEGLVMVWRTESKRDLHMWWVFFPIDIIWLDLSGRVVQIKQGAVPFTRLIKGPKLSSTIIELQAGTIKASSTRVGDTIEF